MQTSFPDILCIGMCLAHFCLKDSLCHYLQFLNTKFSNDRKMYLVYSFSVNTTNTTNNCFSLWLLQHVSTHMSRHQANLEPLNIFEILLTVVFVSKAADRCVSSGWPSVLVQPSIPAGVNTCYNIDVIELVTSLVRRLY
jgi:hypothetical protein